MLLSLIQSWIFTSLVLLMKFEFQAMSSSWLEQSGSVVVQLTRIWAITGSLLDQQSPPIQSIRAFDLCRSSSIVVVLVLRKSPAILLQRWFFSRPNVVVFLFRTFSCLFSSSCSSFFARASCIACKRRLATTRRRLLSKACTNFRLLPSHIPIHCRMFPPLFAFSSFLPLPHTRSPLSHSFPSLPLGKGVLTDLRVCLLVRVCASACARVSLFAGAAAFCASTKEFVLALSLSA